MNKNKRLKLLLSLFITSFVVYFIFKYIDINSIKEIYQRITVSSFLLLNILYFAVYIIRAVRFKLLLPNYENVSMTDLLYITLVHGFYNRILPARTGEVSFVYLALKRHQIDAATGTAAVFLSRLYDLSSICILFFISLFLNKSIPMYNNYLVAVTGLCLVMVLLICIFFNKIMHMLLQQMDKGKFLKKLHFEKIKAKLGMSDTLSKELISTGIWHLALLNLISIIQWVLLYGMFFMLMKEFGIILPYTKIILGSAYSNLTNILPVSGFGGFGTMEAGWVVGFSLLGMDKVEALKTGFMVNIFSFVLTVLYGILALTYDKTRFRRKQSI